MFAYIGYWQLLEASDTFVIYDDVNFIKKGYINRNYILIEGKSQRFTVPLIGTSQNKLINKISLFGDNKKLLRTISLAYKKSPYYDIVYPMIENILSKEENNLAKFIGYSIKQISGYLNIDSNIIYSSDIEKDNSLKGQYKIIDISKKLGATHYLNVNGGRKLYDKELFCANNIQLDFIETQIMEYKQFNNDFVPYLSIIDILMFNNIEEINEMLKAYKLI